MARSTFASKLIATLALSLMALMSGCGGGGGGSSSGTPGGTGGSSPSAPATLDTIIRNPSLATPGNLSPIETAYQQQLAAAPTNVTANAGFAITDAALQAATFQSYNSDLTLQGVLSNSVATQSGSIAKPSVFARLAPSLMIWRLPAMLTAGSTPKLSPLDLIPSPEAALQAHNLNETVEGEQAELEAIDGQLVQVQAALNVVLADPTFVYTIADPTQPTDTNATVQLGSAEFEALLGAVDVAVGVINVAIAYDLQVGSFNVEAPISTVLAAQYTSPTGGVAPVSEWLPAPPFGTITGTGAQDIKTSQEQLEAASTAIVAAVTDVQTRNNSGFLLNPGTVISGSQISSYKTEFENDSLYLTQEETVSTSGGSVLVDLPAFFNNPPTSLLTLMPSLSVTPSGSKLIVLSISASNYPDPTFDGVFPNGAGSLLKTLSYDSYPNDQTPYAAVLL